MKNLARLFVLILTLFFSCKQDDPERMIKKISKVNFPQKWTLVSMSGNASGGQPVTGNNMEYQESYMLNSDSTFIKTRERAGVSKTSVGTYTFQIIRSEAFLILTHEVENELIGNCYADPKEELVLTSADKLSSTWHACDGPGLIYTRED